MENKDTFIWTDDLVKEFVEYINKKRNLTQVHNEICIFKESKEALFTTEDIHDYKKGIVQYSSKEKINEYVLMNKPCLSLSDIKSWLEKYFNYPDGIDTSLLHGLVKEKLNNK